MGNLTGWRHELSDRSYTDHFASLLRVPFEQVSRLFYASALQYVKAKPGTKEYATEGIRHLREFMARNQDALKSVLVEIPDERA